MIVPRAFAVALFAAAERHVRLDAEDRLDTYPLGSFVEVDRPEHVAVIGQRDRRHPLRVRGTDHIVEAIGPVQQAVLSVQVEMDERH